MPSSKSYADLSRELDDILSNLEAEEIDVDDAVKLYERGQKLVGELESRLEAAENKIRDLTQK